MRNTSFARGFIIAVVALALAAVAAPAYAQTGNLKGKIVDAEGKGVPDVEVTLTYNGPMKLESKVTTNKNGEWVKVGLRSDAAGGPTWTITAKKGELVGYKAGVGVMIGVMTTVPDIALGAASAAPKAAPKGMSAEEIKKANEKQLALEKLFTDANAAIEANNYDEAISKLTTMTTEVPACAACHVKLGEVYGKKGDVANAEKAFLKAIEIDDKQADAYSQLSTIYNGQKKFDEAMKMSTKANELMSAAGGAGAATGGDATSLFNQGIIMWNQGKAAEAAALFEKAAKADPKMADAQYYLGLSLYSSGKMAEAKAPLQEYLKLAPTGTNAAAAKGLLDTIK